MKHLIQSQRDEITILLNKGYSHREIADSMGKPHSTIDREIKRNSTRWGYDPHKAQHKAEVRRLYCRKMLKKIREFPELEKYIREHLKEGRTPEDIAGRRNNDYATPEVSFSTIYKYIYSTFGRGLGYYLYSQRHHKKKRKGKKTKRALIPFRTRITERPLIIGQLVEFGHYECDLIVGPLGTHACLLVLIEKLTRFKIVVRLENKKPDGVAKILKKIVKLLKIKSITFDNGVEFMKHYELGIPTYFCLPHHPREKPQVERGNGDIRRYFPKGTRFENVSQKDVDIVVEKLNNKPMKCLNFSTPSEKFHQFFHSQVALLTL